MMKALLRGSWLGPILLLLAGCQSGQQLLLPEATAYASPCQSVSDTAVAVLPAAADSTALPAAAFPSLAARNQLPRTPTRPPRFLTIGQAPRTPPLSWPVVRASETLRLQRARRQSFRFRQPQDETEGNVWLVALGAVLVAAGIVGGLLIGGGLGIFVGIVVGLVGYYFFMRGLLGPHAWLEAVQELFQL